MKSVSFSVHESEIHALCGENGAGKSTLMNILSGVYPTSSCEGEIYLRGQNVKFEDPRAAKQAGIAIIHQELSSFPHLSVAENMVVGDWPTNWGFLNHNKIYENANQWLQTLGASFGPEKLMSELSAGEQQLVEIAKALAQNSDLLILDEPTSSLTPQETEALFKVLRKLKEQGKAIIYISHRLDEIFSLCDRVTVLRDGESVFSDAIQNVTEPELIRAMVGRSLDRLFPPRPEFSQSSSLGPPRLRAQNLEHKKKNLGPLSFHILPGEIVGFAGLLGSGRTEIAQAVLGDRDAGEVFLDGEKISKPAINEFVRASLREGVVLIPEDRKRESLLPHRSLEENRSLTELANGRQRQILSWQARALKSKEALEKLRTKYGSLEQKITELSGGNQQKVILSRYLQVNPDLVILDEPTRGVDVGARYEIYQILFELLAEGKSLLVISSDLQELMGLCDRIYVVSEGRITGELSRSEFSQEKILSLALPTRNVSSGVSLGIQASR